jgi:tetratricopeptide (TPR) repeat protein
VAHANPKPVFNVAHGLACIQDALALTEEILALAPHRARAHTGAAIAAGRLALFTADTRQKVTLCNRIRREAETALRLDPNDDAAHHVLGRWHVEVASLHPVLRLVARHVYGGDMGASTVQGLHHFATARQLAPQRLAHAAEMGKVLIKVGRHREAFETLKQALQCDVEDVNAAMGKMTAERLLRKLRRQARIAAREERRELARQRKAASAAEAMKTSRE